MTVPRLNRPADDVIQEEQRRALRPGGALGVVGGLGYFALLLVHGDLPDQTTAAALEHIAGRPEWRTLKLTLIACVLCWIGAFAALAGSFSTGLGRWLGQWAVAVSAVGATIVIVEYAIIGHALKDIADAWHAAPEAEAATHLQLADVMLTITGGLFHSFVAWMLGLPYVLLGAAVALDRSYPRWLGAIAVVAGAGALFAGATRFLGFDVVPFPLLYGGFVIPLCLWLATMGILMWRRARHDA